MKSYAKINVFLKIVGVRAQYHELNSRFVLVRDLYDEIYFDSCTDAEFKGEIRIKTDKKIEGKNIIQKCYETLANIGFKARLEDFFQNNAVVIKKNIPMGAGLGGGSSNAATFLKMVNSELNLGLKKSQLMQISTQIGADVAFFLSEFEAANVAGIGEIITEFKDEIPPLEIIKSEIFSSTPEVYRHFRGNFINNLDIKFASNLMKMRSSEILASFANYELNDLLRSFEALYGAKLGADEFLSGSGSSKFRRI